MNFPQVLTARNKPSAPSSLSRYFGGGWIFLLLIVVVGIFAVLKPAQFFTTSNMSTLATDASILLVLAIGQTFIIITAGIDLSVGSVLVFSSVVSAKVMQAISNAPADTYGTTSGGFPVIAAGLLAAVLAGCFWGAINGLLVGWARIPALIVTLGTMGMALGFAQLITGGIDVRGVPELLINTLGMGSVLGIPSLVIVALLAIAFAATLLHKTRFGKWTYAIGSNEEAARRVGINTRTHLVKVYALAGALCGVAGLMAVARYGTTTIAGHSADNLATISAVVLGGTSLFGGRGSVFGTVIGIFIPIILLNGFVIVGIPPFWQTISMGAVLVVAVWFDQIKRRAEQ